MSIDEKTLKLLEIEEERLMNLMLQKLSEPKMLIAGGGSIANERMFREMACLSKNYKINIIVPERKSNIPGSNIHFDPFDLILQKQIEEKHGQFINMQMNTLKNKVLKEPIIKSTFQIPMDLNFRKK